MSAAISAASRRPPVPSAPDPAQTAHPNLIGYDVTALCPSPGARLSQPQRVERPICEGFSETAKAKFPWYMTCVTGPSGGSNQFPGARPSPGAATSKSRQMKGCIPPQTKHIPHSCRWTTHPSGGSNQFPGARPSPGSKPGYLVEAQIFQRRLAFSRCCARGRARSAVLNPVTLSIFLLLRLFLPPSAWSPLNRSHPSTSRPTAATS